MITEDPPKTTSVEHTLLPPNLALKLVDANIDSEILSRARAISSTRPEPVLVEQLWQ